MDKLEEKIQEIRDNLNNIDDVLDYFDSLVDETNNTNSIKDLDNFIWKLKLDNLYTQDLEKFINEYMKYHNN